MSLYLTVLGHRCWRDHTQSGGTSSVNNWHCTTARIVCKWRNQGFESISDQQASEIPKLLCSRYGLIPASLIASLQSPQQLFSRAAHYPHYWKQSRAQLCGWESQEYYGFEAHQATCNHKYKKKHEIKMVALNVTDDFILVIAWMMNLFRYVEMGRYYTTED